MERLGRHDVYFNLHATGSILSATIRDGAVVHENIIPRTSCPHSWVKALREMAAIGSDRGTEPPDIETRHVSVDQVSATEQTASHVSRREGKSQEYRAHSGMLATGVSSRHKPPSMDPRQLNFLSSLGTTPAITMATKASTNWQPSSAFPLPDGTSHGEERTAKWSSLRLTKLLRLLDTLRSQPKPAMEGHNEQVYRLHSGLHISSVPQNMPAMQFAGVLGRLSSMPNTSGFVHGMLSWEIFRREEDRLVMDEKISVVLAAKQLNQKMTEVLKHRGKAKDWASDGRKAARIVFRRLEGSSNAVKTFALFLLGSTCSLDSLLKIAHFPVLREYFQEKFAYLVTKMTASWEAMEAEGYKVFDYVELLSPNGPQVTQSDHKASSPDAVFQRPTPPMSDESEGDPSSIHGSFFHNSPCSILPDVDFYPQTPLAAHGHFGDLDTLGTDSSTYDMLQYDNNLLASL